MPPSHTHTRTHASRAQARAQVLFLHTKTRKRLRDLGNSARVYAHMRAVAYMCKQLGIGTQYVQLLLAIVGMTFKYQTTPPTHTRYPLSYQISMPSTSNIHINILKSIDKCFSFL